MSCHQHVWLDSRSRVMSTAVSSHHLWQYLSQSVMYWEHYTLNLIPKFVSVSLIRHSSVCDTLLKDLGPLKKSSLMSSFANSHTWAVPLSVSNIIAGHSICVRQKVINHHQALSNDHQPICHACLLIVNLHDFFEFR